MSEIPYNKAMEKLQKSLLNTLDRFNDIKVCILFGSTAAGKASTHSDLDIAVAGEKPLSEDMFLKLMEAFSESTNREIDLIDLIAVSGPILNKALTTGRLILNQDKTLYARLMSRMLFDEADMMPYYHRTLRERRRRFLNGQGSH